NFRKNKNEALQLPKIDEALFNQTEKPIQVSVEDAVACPRYAGIVIDNITVQPSPIWLQNKLKAIGQKPINNIVDITNYILHEYGQPLHAFDLNAITDNQIVVKTVANKTSFVALDGTTIELLDTDLMICNAKEPMCIAGVYGGLNSGVKNTTTTIFLESAYFNPKSIRQTSTKHQLRTEAATHFEKGIDPNITITALKRAAQLIVEIANGKIISDITDIQNQTFPNTIVPLNINQVQQLLGKQIPTSEIKNILHCLEIDIVDEQADQLQVSVPAYRTDVKRSADVIEEILRIYGFNNIPIPSKINASVSFTTLFDDDAVYQTIANVLVANGFYEIMTNPLTKSTYLEKLSTYPNFKKEEWVHLLSSINVELDVLRNNMLFSGLESVAYNINHKQARIAFFELGKSYHKKENYEEHEHLVLYMSGVEQDTNWNRAERTADFYSLKSIVQLILNKLGTTNYSIQDTQSPYFDFGLDYIFGDKTMLSFGKVNTTFQQLFGIKQAVYFATINWKNLLQLVQEQKIKYRPISKYPTVKRDLALLVNQSVSFHQIETIAKQTAKKLLQTVDVFDIYQDEKIGKENKSYAVSFSFKDDNKTLTDNEIDAIMKKLISKFEKELQASIR
ncbi:MAG: phenylalanine--tRNA ligase subunit beta, partial [Chitinophagales bacterium]